MLTTKSLYGLFAIAAGGFLNSAMSQTGLPIAVQPQAPVSAIVVQRQATSAPAQDAMQTASNKAVFAALRTDLGDGAIKLQLSEFRFDPVSSQSLEGKSRGSLLFDGATSVPIVATVIYDLPLSRVDNVTYSIDGTTPSSSLQPVVGALRERIADVIGSRLVMEFSQQPVDFSLLNVRSIANGPARLLIDGDGITRFPGEGAAYTRFVAVADKSSGRVVAIKYDLSREMQ